MGELATMDSSGDTKVSWDPSKPGEVAAARATFDSLRAKGYAAYRMNGENQGEQIFTFDPAAGRIILAPAMQGG